MRVSASRSRRVDLQYVEYPSHLTSAQFQEYIESYARHFDLLKHVVFKACVNRARRNDDDSQWQLDMVINGKTRVEEFDKVVFCHGYQTEPVMPKYEGAGIFEGKLLHAQQFRKYDLDLFLNCGC